jgi:flagellar assembly protein FliH
VTDPRDGARTSGIDGLTPAGAPRPAEGAVLRDVALQREPRQLRRPGRPGGSPAARDPRGHAAQGTPSHPFHPGADAYEPGPLGGVQRDPSELAAAASFHEGYLSGKAEAEVAAAAEAEVAKRAGYEEGHARGQLEGRAEGLRKGLEEARQAMESEARASRAAAAERSSLIEGVLEKLTGQVAGALATAEADMVSLCHLVVCRLLGEQLVTAEGVAGRVRQAIREHLGDVSEALAVAAFTVHLHPRDLDLLREAPQLASWLDGSAPGAGAPRWVADPEVPRGGCLITSADGTLDARLESQLEALRQLLVDAPAGGQGAAR